MGFSDKETVCLILLGHMFGRCHPETSGYENPWYAFSPNEYSAYEGGLGYLSTYVFGISRGAYKEVITSGGKRQWEARLGGGLAFMMLPADMALWWDEAYRKHVIFYDRERRKFRKDAGKAWKKLIELGCDGWLTPEL